MMTEREVSIKCAASVQRDINKHMDRIKELVQEARYFQICIRDASLSDAEQIAALEARIWWEERSAA
jgi:hypothetical protein